MMKCEKCGLEAEFPAYRIIKVSSFMVARPTCPRCGTDYWPFEDWSKRSNLGMK